MYGRSAAVAGGRAEKARARSPRDGCVRKRPRGRGEGVIAAFSRRYYSIIPLQTQPKFFSGSVLYPGIFIIPRCFPFYPGL